MQSEDSFDLNQLEHDVLLYEDMLSRVGFNPSSYSTPCVIPPSIEQTASTPFQFMYNNVTPEVYTSDEENYQAEQNCRSFINRVLKEKNSQEAQQAIVTPTEQHYRSTTTSGFYSNQNTVSRSGPSVKPTCRTAKHMNIIKKQLEMEHQSKCTFQPVTNNSRRKKPSQISTERIQVMCRRREMELKRRIEEKQRREYEDMRSCPFKPKIDPISNRIVSQLRGYSTPEARSYASSLEHENKENRQVMSDQGKQRPKYIDDEYQFQLVRIPLSNKHL